MSAAPEVRSSASRSALATAVAVALLDRLADAQSRGEVPQVGLTGGTIADELHRELARLSPESPVDWSRVVLWWGDERWAPAGDAYRNEVQAHEAFISEVGVDPANVHVVPASDAGLSLAEAALAYSETMREHGAGSFEVLMLGIGPDGHVASLFPGHPAAQVRDAIAVPVEDSPKPPPERVSLTFEAMEHSRAVWFVAAGADKAEAVARALSGPAEIGSPEAVECPARVPRGTVETIFWLDPDTTPS
ncbi:6-phosphogluconolactonase [Nocardioides alpinus]|uniref:6-phosphogluconolactonase n=1 Tax=Nocardioides alpinus TaxID=748909 RepID=A0A1I0ZQ15_9ACTN|nr:6-phosphogluconolactonase [Nocardioides alpinus]PKH41879.1 6-phosphogluconolactonase [Nocardioides alpinus]SFB27637.1 6-phosphogluconolactonase [Nocardioides alpinus]